MCLRRPRVLPSRFIYRNINYVEVQKSLNTFQHFKRETKHFSSNTKKNNELGQINMKSPTITPIKEDFAEFCNIDSSQRS